MVMAQRFRIRVFERIIVKNAHRRLRGDHHVHLHTGVQTAVKVQGPRGIMIVDLFIENVPVHPVHHSEFERQPVTHISPEACPDGCGGDSIFGVLHIPSLSCAGTDAGGDKQVHYRCGTEGILHLEGHARHGGAPRIAGIYIELVPQFVFLREQRQRQQQYQKECLFFHNIHH